jgi:hypothetical protein
MSYSSIVVIYGNIANGNLGDWSGLHSTLYINGVGVAATSSVAPPFSQTYSVNYTSTIPGVLQSIGVSPGVTYQYESNICQILLDGQPLNPANFN